MKRIFSSPDLAAVSALKDTLEAAGIACFISNEVTSALAGGIPQGETFPELWIDDESREAEAGQIIKEWRTPQPQATPWTCPKCGEKLEPQFTSCWNCERRGDDSLRSVGP